MSIHAMLKDQRAERSAEKAQIETLIRDLRLLADALEENGSYSEFARDANSALGLRTNRVMNIYFDRLQQRLAKVYLYVRIEYLERKATAGGKKP